MINDTHIMIEKSIKADLYKYLRMEQMVDERLPQTPDLYKYLLQSTDFDHLDDYICDKVLNLGVKGHKAVSAVVAECASRTNNYLMHQGIEPGTAAAFRAYVSALHQMYLMGVAMELKRLGYKMQLA